MVTTNLMLCFSEKFSSQSKNFSTSGEDIAGDDLAQRVDKDLGNVVIAGIQAADETLEGIESVDAVFAGFHQANAVMNIVGQFGIALDAHHIAGFGFGGFVDQVDHLLCFAGAFDAHNYSYHNCSTPLDNKRWRWFLLCI